MLEKYQEDWNNGADLDMKAPMKDDSAYNPYYNQPTHSPYRYQGFAIASVVFSVLCFFFSSLFIIAFIFASFSILFAALGYRRHRSNHRMLTYAAFFTCFGLVSSILTIFRYYQ